MKQENVFHFVFLFFSLSDGRVDDVEMCRIQMRWTT